jgi:CheY-like chemotaxis protein
MAMVDQAPPIVLIVEDSPAKLLLARAILRRAGYHIDEARSAEEAIERLTARLPHLILMDIQLPGKDGLALTREIRADPRTGHIPIVALTANAMQGDADRCMELAASAASASRSTREHLPGPWAASSTAGAGRQ